MFKGALKALGDELDPPPTPLDFSEAKAMEVRASSNTVCSTRKMPVVRLRNTWSSGLMRMPQHTREMHCPSLSPAQVHLLKIKVGVSAVCDRILLVLNSLII
jgi:hypothetical protein